MAKSRGGAGWQGRTRIQTANVTQQRRTIQRQLNLVQGDLREAQTRHRLAAASLENAIASNRTQRLIRVNFAAENVRRIERNIANLENQLSALNG